jgi:AcrR family transcriptional regulator
MPKVVDHEERREEIVQAAIEILSTGGPSMLTMEAVGRKLGGSTRMVNHYYPSRGDLLADLGPRLRERWARDLQAVDTGSADARRRLRAFLVWRLAHDTLRRASERAFLALLWVPSEDAASASAFHERGSEWMRGQIALRLAGIVAHEDVDSMVDILQTSVSGILVAAEENPDRWPPEREVAVVDRLLEMLGLAPEKELVGTRTEESEV